MKQGIMPTCLLILGCGYVGTKLAQSCVKQGIKVKATVRNPKQIMPLQKLGIDTLCADNPSLLPQAWLNDCDALLDSIPLSYDVKQVPFQSQMIWVEPLLARMPALTWAAYLSATSVYADSFGGWIDETTPPDATHPRGQTRVLAENVWLNSSAPAEIFRLAGIYGEERNIIDKLMVGNYKTIQWQPEHYSNRIHVDDIVAALIAAMSSPCSDRVLNLCDDAPCSHTTYATELAALVGAPAPIVLSPEEAKLQLSAKFISFFADNKRISNQELRQQLLPTLKYANFRIAVPSLLKSYKP